MKTFDLRVICVHTGLIIYHTPLSSCVCLAVICSTCAFYHLTGSKHDKRSSPWSPHISPPWVAEGRPFEQVSACQ